MITFNRGTTAVPSGSVSRPSISFAGDIDTGFYHPAADQVAITLGGVQNVLFTPTLITFGAPFAITGNLILTTASANALTVGRQGSTNPALNIDASAALSATGVGITAAAAGGGVAVAALSSGANEALSLDARGSGQLNLATVSTGTVTVGTSLTLTGTPANASTVGALRMVNNTLIGWRNAAGNANITLGVDGSDFIAGTARFTCASTLPGFITSGGACNIGTSDIANLQFSTNGIIRFNLRSSYTMSFGIAVSAFTFQFIVNTENAWLVQDENGATYYALTTRTAGANHIIHAFSSAAPSFASVAGNTHSRVGISAYTLTQTGTTTVTVMDGLSLTIGAATLDNTSAGLTITTASSVNVAGPLRSGNATITNAYSINLPTFASTGATIAANIHAVTPTAAASNFGLLLGTAGTSTGAMGIAGATSGIVTVTVAAVAGTWTMTLPANDGDASQFLQTDGNGVTSWQTVSSAWSSLTAPVAALALTMPATNETTFTVQSTTQRGFTWTSSTITSGGLLTASLTGASAVATAATNGVLATFSSTTTGFTGATQRLVGVFASGANANASAVVQGVAVSVTNTGTTNTNTALLLTASGGSTSNFAIDITAGGVNTQAALTWSTVANTALVWRITDGTNAYYAIDTRTGITGVLAHAFDVTNPSFGLAGGNTFSLASLNAFTLTQTGGGVITALGGLSLVVSSPLVTADLATTVTTVSTVQINGPVPNGGGGATPTFTNSFALDIPTFATNGTTAAGARFAAPSGATSNFAWISTGNARFGNNVGIYALSSGGNNVPLLYLDGSNVLTFGSGSSGQFPTSALVRTGAISHNAPGWGTDTASYTMLSHSGNSSIFRVQEDAAAADWIFGLDNSSGSSYSGVGRAWFVRDNGASLLRIIIGNTSTGVWTNRASSNTAACYTIGDSTNAYYTLNTQTATDNTVNHTFAVGTAITVTQVAGTTHSNVSLSTYTFTGSTNATAITALSGLQLTIGSPTVAQSGGAFTVTTASSMIVNGPLPGASITLTNSVALDIPTYVTNGTTASGLRVAAPSGAVTNYAINVTSGRSNFQDINIASTASPNVLGAPLNLNTGGNQGATNIGGPSALLTLSGRTEASGGSPSIQMTDGEGYANVYYTLVCRTIDNLTTHAFTQGQAPSFAAAAGSTHVLMALSAYTLTLTGNAAPTTALNGLSLNIAAPTVSNGTAHTTTIASTLYISGAPIAAGAGPETLTNSFALHVAGGGVAIAAGGLWIGSTSSTNNEFSSASVGAGSTTMYIGNAAITTVSDLRLKTAITPTVLNATALFRQARIVDFDWNDPSDRNLMGKARRGRYTGMLAQETLPLFPWIVNAEGRDCVQCLTGLPCLEHGSMQVEYQHLVPLLVKGHQELDTRLVEAERRIAVLEEENRGYRLQLAS